MIIKPVRAAVLVDDVFRGSRLFGIGELVRWPSRRQALGAGGGLLVLVLTMLAALRFAETSWPLVHGHPGVLAAAGLLFLLASALKIYAWRALFSADERPRTLALAAGSAARSFRALFPCRPSDPAEPRTPRRGALVMLGLVDTAGRAGSSAGNPSRVAESRWKGDGDRGRRALVPARAGSATMVFLCAGAAVGALPIAPAGAATQAGAGAAGLVASGVGTSQAIEVAVAGQTLGALAGIAMLVFCLVRHVKTRAPCRPLGERPPSRPILAP
jgi:hypothetical protein